MGTVEDDTGHCECVRYCEDAYEEYEDKEAQDAAVSGQAPCMDFMPVVGAWVMCRGSVKLDRLFSKPERTLVVGAMRFLSPTKDDLLLSVAERESMRKRYGFA